MINYQLSMHRFSCLWVFLILLSSCVSQLKYNRVSEEVISLRNERESIQKRAESLKVQLEKTSKDLVICKDDNDALKRDSAQIGSLYRRNKTALEDLYDKYENLSKSYNDLLSSSSTEKKENDQELREKEMQLARLTKELDETKTNILKAQKELENKKEEAEKLSKSAGEKEEKMRAMEIRMESREKLAAGLMTRLETATRDLVSKDFIVTLKEGKISIYIQNDSLFVASGYELGASGKQAIRKLAQVLVQEEGFDIRVEAHTDIIPLKTPAPAPASVVKKPVTKGKKKTVVPVKVVPPSAPVITDNWDLSALRAIQVSRELYLLGLPGDRITAAGKGDFFPLDSSTGEAARRRNRRVEIIISPRI
jgi:chemotaxis protein MotB